LAILLGAAAAIFLARLREEPEPEEAFSSQAAVGQSNPGWEAQGGSSPAAAADESAPKQSDNVSQTVEEGGSNSKLFVSHKTRILRREERRVRRLEREALADGRKRKKDTRQGVFRIREIFEGTGGSH